jgi:hypothetical protein
MLIKSVIKAGSRRLIIVILHRIFKTGLYMWLIIRTLSDVFIDFYVLAG